MLGIGAFARAPTLKDKCSTQRFLQQDLYNRPSYDTLLYALSRSKQRQLLQRRRLNGPLAKSAPPSARLRRPKQRSSVVFLCFSCGIIGSRCHSAMLSVCVSVHLWFVSVRKIAIVHDFDCQSARYGRRLTPLRFNRTLRSCKPAHSEACFA